MQNVSPESALKWIKPIVIIMIVVIVTTILYNVYKASQNGAKIIGNELGSEIIEKQTGISKARQLICSDVAEKIHLLMWGEDSWWNKATGGKWSEDEDGVIQQLNRLVSGAESALTSQRYQELWGAKNLKADVKKYLSTTQQQQINSEILQNLV